MFGTLALVGFALVGGVFIGIWIHGLELWNKAQTHDLVDQQWKKRG